MADNANTIIIRGEASGTGYGITVDPAPRWASFNAERPTLRAAKRYAESLRVVHGWKIRDETGEAA